MQKHLYIKKSLTYVVLSLFLSCVEKIKAQWFGKSCLLMDTLNREEFVFFFCGSDLCFKGKNDLSILHENVDHASLATGVVVGECPQFLASETHPCLCAHPTLPTLLPWWLSSKESACQFRRHRRNIGDVDSIPGLGRSPGEGNGNPF